MTHCLSAAKNTVVRGLENVEAPEGGEALFECVLSQPEVAAHTWLLDDEPVRTQSYPTLCHLMDCSLLGFSVHGIFQARVLEWGAIA